MFGNRNKTKSKTYIYGGGLIQKKRAVPLRAQFFDVNDRQEILHLTQDMLETIVGYAEADWDMSPLNEEGRECLRAWYNSMGLQTVRMDKGLQDIYGGAEDALRDLKNGFLDSPGQ